jgi:hypothetical protein
MPFKSEKQRRYLWANEPEIARDWTDTYGSRIEKSNGGITDMVTVPKHWQSAPGHPKTELAYITKAEKDLLVKKDLHNSLEDGPNTGPGGVMSLNGDLADMEAGITGADISAAERGETPRGMDPNRAAELRAGFIAAGGAKGRDKSKDTKQVKKQIKQIKKASAKRKKDVIATLKAQKLKAKKKQAFINHLKQNWTYNPSIDPEEIADMLESQFEVTTNPDGTISYDFTGDPITTGFQKNTRYNVPTNTQLGPFGLKDKGVKGEPLGTKYIDTTPDFSTIVTAPLISKFTGLTNPNYNTLLSTFNRVKKLDDIKTKEGWQGYWDDVRKRQKTVGGGGDGPQPWWMQQGYPSYEAWKAAQGQGTTTVAEEVVEDTPSAFQQSLNTGIAQGISPYYVGANPTAANISWGQQFNVDPRTMYMAEGGPIRQRYFLGKLVKKIGRAAKKVIKSPLGKAALIGGLGWAAHAGKLGPWGEGIFGRDKLGKFLTKKMEGEAWDPWKLGIMGASVLPFFMGGKEEEDQDKPFDYDAAKNAYLNEIMNIKRGVMAGSLNPNQWSYLPSNYTFTGAQGGRIGYQGGGMEDPMLVDEYKKYVFEMEEMGLQPMSFDEFKAQAIAGMARGGRAGYYAGGQSIPSEYTMEDARKTAMQDRLGGITEVMKQADLYRQGDVGQMYMAEGGPTQEAGIMDLGGVEKDYRETGGFVPIGKEEKADDVPARLSLNEFVMTADAVRGMGDGDVDQGAERMEDLMETLEVKGKKNQGAQDMFEVSERLSAVV